MTDYRDPNRMDYDPYRRTDRYLDRDEPMSAGTWGWVLGIVLVIGVMIYAFGTRTDGTQVAQSPSNPHAESRPAPKAPTTPAPTR